MQYTTATVTCVITVATRRV